MSVHPARSEIYDLLFDRLEAEVEAGIVNRSRDAETGLNLYVYSKSCVYERAWTPTTKLARGLVLDTDSRRVVATPFPKFYNVHEPEAGSIPAEPFEVFDKMDGSLAILFFHGGRWRAATKGSFTSDQAKWAEAQIVALNLRFPGVFVPGTTYLAEAIYPENRIVIQYPPEHEGLWLLAAYDEGGRELSYEELNAVAAATRFRMKIVPRRAVASITELIERAKELPPTEEGWVLRFASGHRVKLKGDAYLAIHRAVSRLTPLSVWEALSTGGGLAGSMRALLPEEFWADFDRIVELLQDWYEVHERLLEDLVDETKILSDKELGLALQNPQFFTLADNPLARFLFTARKAPDKIPSKLWPLVRPTGNRLEGYRPQSSVSRIQEEE